MTLKPCPPEYGGRCANGAACKQVGGADAESHQWKFVDKADKERGKICKTCARVPTQKESKAAGKRAAREEEDEEVTAGDTLVEIITIYQIRCAHASNPGTARVPACGSRVVCPPCASCCVCAHSIATRARGRVERESKVSKEARQLAYLVYGKFRYDGRDKKGVFRFGTEWVVAEQMAEQSNWGEKEDEFDRRVRAMRAPLAGGGDDEGDDESSSSSDDDSDDD
jgi:hypothetical protein